MSLLPSCIPMNMAGRKTLLDFPVPSFAVACFAKFQCTCYLLADTPLSVCWKGIPLSRLWEASWQAGSNHEGL